MFPKLKPSWWDRVLGAVESMPTLIGIVLVLLLSVVVYNPRSSDVPNILGSALGAFIAVAMSAVVANAGDRRRARGFAKHCAKLARDYRDQLLDLRDAWEAAEASSVDGLYTIDAWKKLVDLRDVYIRHSGTWVVLRIKNMNLADLYDLPEPLLDAVAQHQKEVGNIWADVIRPIEQMSEEKVGEVRRFKSPSINTAARASELVRVFANLAGQFNLQAEG
jgi:hypothetical protein